MRRLFSSVGLLCLAIFATAEGWQTTKLIRAHASRKGKTVATYRSPDKKATLLFVDEGEAGDFVWRTLYLKTNKGSWKVDAYNAISKVAWTKDSKGVSFRADKAVDFNKVAHLEARLTIGGKVVQTKVRSTEKIDH